jgi:hypothetical protein
MPVTLATARASAMRAPGMPLAACFFFALLDEEQEAGSDAGAAC